MERANRFFREGAYDEALLLADSLLENAGQRARVTAWILKGRHAQNEARFDEAVEAYRQALEISKGTQDQMAESRALNQLSNVYLKQGDHEAALRCALENLRMKERLADTAGVARARHNLAMIYYEQGDLEAAQEALRSSIAIKTSLGDSMGIHNALHLQCMLAIDAGRPEEGVMYMERALAMIERNFPHVDPVPTLVNLGLAHDGSDRPMEAVRWYEKALVALEEHPNDAHRAVLHMDLGQLLMAEGRMAEAGDHLGKSLVLARSVGSLQEEQAALRALMKYHEQIGDHALAFRMAEALLVLNDSLLNVEKVRSMNELRVRYDTERAAAENERLLHANDLAEVRLQRQRAVIAGIVVGVVLLMLVTLLLVRNWRRRVALRLKDLEHQALRAQMDPHFLFNALSSIPGLYYEVGPVRATDYVGHLGQLLRLILDSSAKRVVPVQVELDLITHYFQVMEWRHPEQFTWAVRVDPDIDTERIGIPPMLIQPLVENALLHGIMQRSAAEGHVEVHLSSTVRGVRCCVTDNGPGMRTAPDLSTAGRPSGLRITHERIRLASGRSSVGLLFKDMEQVSGGSGTEVCFDIPTEDLWK